MDGDADFEILFSILFTCLYCVVLCLSDKCGEDFSSGPRTNGRSTVGELGMDWSKVGNKRFTSLYFILF